MLAKKSQVSAGTVSSADCVMFSSWCCLHMQVFDAYAQFEESMISAKMETTEEMGSTEEGIKRHKQLTSVAQCCQCSDCIHLVTFFRTNL